jgi:hypothetical protein
MVSTACSCNRSGFRQYIAMMLKEYVYLFLHSVVQVSFRYDDPTLIKILESLFTKLCRPSSLLGQSWILGDFWMYRVNILRTFK